MGVRGVLKWRSLALLLAAATGLALVPLPAAAFEPPALITSVGQSTDVAMVDVVLNTRGRMGLPVKEVAEAADLASIKTLIVVLGASSKGLGAAGTDSGAEYARAEALLETAKARGVKILALHVGGEARRGRLSDPFIELGARYADAMIAVAAGNADGFLTRLSHEAGYDFIEISRVTELADVIKSLF